MNKTFKIYGIILVLVLVLLAVLEANKKEVIDWSHNYRLDSKSPFGLYIFSQEANKLFGNKLEKSPYSPYNYYGDKPHTPHNILIINRYIDEESRNKILKQVKNGSDAFIAKEHFYDYDLTDTLKIETSSFDIPFDINQETQNIIEDKGDAFTLFLTDKKLSKDSIYIDREPNTLKISHIDSNHQILGYASYGKDKNTRLGANFVKIKYGKGHFYLLAEPQVFTNYHLTKPNGERYSQSVLSYLPDRKTIWFVDDLEVSSTSSLRFILSKPALKYAWWIFLAGLLLFILFNIKRKQRIVPIIEPKKNKSVEFVKSIGNLYLNEGDFRDMMTKKAQYFLNRVRMELLIDTQYLDEKFIKMLHLKTGKSTEKIQEAIELIKKAQDPYSFVTQEDLVKMNKILDEIYI